MELKEFQKKAIAGLNAACRRGEKEIVLKSCTGSGKTVILTHFIDRYLKENANTCFIWFTPGQGGLEEQSKSKMDAYLPMSRTKLLADVLTSGFEEGDVAFINWEMVTNKKNNAMREGETFSLPDRIRDALRRGLSFLVVVDEQHFNNTYKANEIIRLFRAEKIIRASATPVREKGAYVIEIPEEEVIAEGLIKKSVYINEGIAQGAQIGDEEEYLLDLALEKRQALVKAFEGLKDRERAISPLIIIQLPNRSAEKQAKIEKILKERGISYSNKRLAVWLAGQKENLEKIDAPDAAPEAIIIKQAVAVGWDCPRAYILVKIRENMDEVFEIQTIGRIRRMPEARHYGDPLLDNCYIYTFDKAFIEYAKKAGGAGETKKVFLKPQFCSFRLTKELKPSDYFENDPVSLLKTAHAFFTEKYSLTANTARNRILLETKGKYRFDETIVHETQQGSISLTDDPELYDLRVNRSLSTHTDGRLFHHSVGEIADAAGMKYDSMVIILRRLFDGGVVYGKKLLELSTKHLYAFVINNRDLLKADFKSSAAAELQGSISSPRKDTAEFAFPRECNIVCAEKYLECRRNVYEGYLLSREGKSEVELEFEKWCEKRAEWFYKNGDRGSEYFSVVYTNEYGKPRLFYPDYILSIRSQIWIIETKGGESRTGADADIDAFSVKKFNALKGYLAQYGLNGGFVVLDETGVEKELFITTEMYRKYSEDRSQYRPLDEFFS